MFLFAPAGSTMTIKSLSPVSYTHLDVYKRQRKAFNGKGVVIVKSTEQAGAFTLYADSDRLQSDQVSLFTGKKDQAERTVLGVEPCLLYTSRCV